MKNGSLPKGLSPTVVVTVDRCFGMAVFLFGAGFIVAPLLLAPWTDSSRRGTQPADAQQVVGGAGEMRQQLGALDAPNASLAQATHGLHPAEDFLNALAFTLAQGVALVPGDAGIEARGLSAFDPGYVRDAAVAAQARDEVLRVVTLVRPEGLGLHAFALRLKNIDVGAIHLSPENIASMASTVVELVIGFWLLFGRVDYWVLFGALVMRENKRSNLRFEVDAQKQRAAQAFRYCLSTRA